jgi:predicted protein tyrosine phosphatase
MNIKVFSQKAIGEFKTDKSHAVISIQDPFEKFVYLPKNKNRVGVLKLKFYDFDGEQGIPIYDAHLFTEKDANYILNFVERIKDRVDLICVNCVAGVSRSAGIASALSKIYNNDDSYYFKHYCPNMFIYRTILNIHYNEKDKNEE